MTTPIVQLKNLDGSVWSIYEDGRFEGFPEGTFIFNRIPLVLAEIAFCVNKQKQEVEAK